MTTEPDDVLEVSVRMLALAHAGDWEGVALLEAERTHLLEQMPDLAPGMLDTVKTLLVHNEEIRALANEAQARIGEALGEHQHRHRALSTYLHVGGD